MELNGLTWLALSHICNIMSSDLSNISVQDLKRAVVLRERIEEMQHELAGILGEPSSGTGGAGRRAMSASARARIAAAQRRRWRKHRNEKGAAPAAKKTRRMSAAARARIAASAKARWAKAKAKGQRTLAS